MTRKYHPDRQRYEHAQSLADMARRGGLDPAPFVAAVPPSKRQEIPKVRDMAHEIGAAFTEAKRDDDDIRGWSPAQTATYRRAA